MNSMPGTPGSASTPEQHVLVVCAANVCRSPSMEFFLHRHLAEAAPDTRWLVESAGTTARPGDTMCSRSAGYVQRTSGGAAFVSRHRAKLLTLAAVERAGLVLVASDAERAAVASLSPQARRRTFTLRQAAMLMDRFDTGQRRGMTLVTEGPDLLETIVDLLHEQRGTLSISAGPAHLSSRRARKHVPLTDIPDVHQGHERRHKTVLKTISTASKSLADGVGLVSPRLAPSPAVRGESVEVRGVGVHRGDVVSDR